MNYRKAAFFAVAGLLASSGMALADNAPKTSLSLDPTVITADAGADRAPLMMLLDKAGAAKPLDDLKLNIYGWIEAGYTYNHRHNGNEDEIAVASIQRRLEQFVLGAGLESLLRIEAQRLALCAR